MSDNNKNEIKETWKDKVFLVLGGLLILVIFMSCEIGNGCS